MGTVQRMVPTVVGRHGAYGADGPCRLFTEREGPMGTFIGLAWGTTLLFFLCMTIAVMAWGEF